MNNKFYTLKDFVFYNTPDTYPVILKGNPVIDNETIDVYIDSLSGFIINTPNSSIRLSGCLAGTDKGKAIKAISNKLEITIDKATELFELHIDPSIIKPNIEDLSKFFKQEDFYLYTNIIEAEYKYGFSKGRTVISHTRIPSIWISADWTYLNGDIKFAAPVLEGIHTSNVETNKYVEVVVKDLLLKFTSTFLNKSGKALNGRC